MTAIERLAIDNGYDLVLDVSGIVYLNPAPDITDKIIRRIDKKYQAAPLSGGSRPNGGRQSSSAPQRGETKRNMGKTSPISGLR